MDGRNGLEKLSGNAFARAEIRIRECTVWRGYVKTDRSCRTGWMEGDHVGGGEQASCCIKAPEDMSDGRSFSRWEARIVI
nr:hypothetical protein CFP56_65907 [Quercus suber]